MTLTDTSTPPQIAALATDAVRAVNHRTISPLIPGEPGWQWASDIYKVLGSLASLAPSLGQLCDQLARALTTADVQDRLTVDPETPWDSTTGAVAAAADALRDARQAAHSLAHAIEQAHQITGTLNTIAD